jgi:flagellar motility protein MotE (MotC chaperone)
MNSKIANPIVVAALGLVLGVFVGLGWFWFRSGDMITDAIVSRRLFLAQKEQQQRVQGWDYWTIEIENLSSELKEQKEALQRRSDQLDRREAQIASEKRDLENLRDDEVQMRNELDQRIITIGADEDKNLHMLAKTYETLTAPSAVAIVRELDQTTAVKILSLMKPDDIGPIFEEMAIEAKSDPTMARLAADLSDKLRLMKAAAVSANP